MSRFGLGPPPPSKPARSDSPPPAPANVIDMAVARALLHQEELAQLAQTMHREGRSPELIEAALGEENVQRGSPLDEEAITELLGPFVKDYVPQLIKVSMEGFNKTVYPSPRFIVETLVPRSEVTLFGGHGGSGKSILLLAIAAHVACGKAWAGLEVERCGAVFVTLEDDANVVMHRLKKIVQNELLDVAEVEANLRIVDGSAGSTELMIERTEYGTHSLIATQMLREVEEAAAGAGLIIIDNASDAFGGNENDRRSVRTFIRALLKIAKANDAALVLLAHIDKNAARHGSNGNGYSGSTAWNNSVRSRAALVEVDGQPQLHHEKANRSQKAAPVPLMWTDDGVLVPGKSGTAAEARTQQAQGDTDAALLAIRAAQSHNIRVTAAASGPATSWHAVQHLGEMGTFRGKDAKRRFHSALVTLQSTGLLHRIDFKNDQRKSREVWELTAMGEAAARRIAP